MLLYIKLDFISVFDFCGTTQRPYSTTERPIKKSIELNIVDSIFAASAQAILFFLFCHLVRKQNITCVRTNATTRGWLGRNLNLSPPRLQLASVFHLQTSHTA